MGDRKMIYQLVQFYNCLGLVLARTFKVDLDVKQVFNIWKGLIPVQGHPGECLELS